LIHGDAPDFPLFPIERNLARAMALRQMKFQEILASSLGDKPKFDVLAEDRAFERRF
jgi:hypothetical protein